MATISDAVITRMNDRTERAFAILRDWAENVFPFSRWSSDPTPMKIDRIQKSMMFCDVPTDSIQFATREWASRKIRGLREITWQDNDHQIRHVERVLREISRYLERVGLLTEEYFSYVDPRYSATGWDRRYDGSELHGYFTEIEQRLRSADPKSPEQTALRGTFDGDDAALIRVVEGALKRSVDWISVQIEEEAIHAELDADGIDEPTDADLRRVKARLRKRRSVANNPVQKVDVDKSLVEAVKGALVEEETLRDFIEQAIRDRLKVLESKESK